MQLAKIGTEFSYNDKKWRVSGISKQTIYFKSLDGSLKSQMEVRAFERLMDESLSK